MQTMRNLTAATQMIQKGKAKAMAECVPVIEKPTTFNRSMAKIENKTDREENQFQTTRHTRMMMNPGRDQT